LIIIVLSRSPKLHTNVELHKKAVDQALQNNIYGVKLLCPLSANSALHQQLALGLTLFFLTSEQYQANVLLTCVNLITPTFVFAISSGIMLVNRSYKGKVEVKFLFKYSQEA